MFRFVLLLSVGLTITLILPLSAFGVNMAPPEIVTPRSAEPPSYPLAKILDQEAVSKMLATSLFASRNVQRNMALQLCNMGNSMGDIIHKDIEKRQEQLKYG